MRPGIALLAGSIRIDAGAALLSSVQLAEFEETRVERLVVRVIDLPVADGALGVDYLSRSPSLLRLRGECT